MQVVLGNRNADLEMNKTSRSSMRLRVVASTNASIKLAFVLPRSPFS